MFYKKKSFLISLVQDGFSYWLIPFFILGISMTLAVYNGSTQLTLGFATSFAIAGMMVGVGFLGGKICVPNQSYRMSSLAWHWILIPFCMAIPFYFDKANYQTFPSAFFEAMSGLTSAGLTMAAKPADLAQSLQLYRSILQWIGGIGICVLAVFLQSQGYDEAAKHESNELKFLPHKSMRQNIVRIVILYSLLTFITGIIFYLLGMPAWESFNHSLTSISTGGFSITNDSFSSYSPAIKIFCALVLIVGSVGFAFVYFGAGLRFSILLRRKETLYYMGIIATGLIFLWLIPSRDSGRYFNFISAATTAGFSDGKVQGSILPVLIGAMLIGGCQGSTAGGIKVHRFRILCISLVSLFKERSDISAETIAQAGRFFFMWMATILIAAIVIMGFDPAASFSPMFFDLVSAIGTTGLSYGYISPESPAFVKYIFSFLMWVGRLEIYTAYVGFLWWWNDQEKKGS